MTEGARAPGTEPTRLLAGSLVERATDACALALAAGAALNLATGQGTGVLLIGLLLVAHVRGHAGVRAAVTDLGDAWWAVLAFLAACAVSTLTTLAPWPGTFDATRWRPMLVLPAAMVAFAWRGPALARACAGVFAAGCAVHALVGLWQVATGDAPLADLLHIPADRRVIPAPGNADLRAAGGLFYNRVRLSHVLAAGTAVSLVLAWGRGRARAGWATAAALAFAGLMFTYGRAALGALVATLAMAALVVAVRGDRDRRRVVFVAVTGLALVGGTATAAVPALRERMASAVDFSRNQDRLFLWGRGAEIAMDHAPVGAGFGGYAVVRDAYYDRVDENMESRMMSHHLPLSLLAETGVWGLLAWLWAWWALYRRAWRNPNLVAVAGAVAAGTFHAATLAHDPLYQSECALAWAFCGALMVAPGGKVAPQRTGTV